MERERLLCPAVTCKHCGSLPPLRIAPEERERYRQDAPNHVVGTLRCPACHRIYPVTAAAYQAAA